MSQVRSRTSKAQATLIGLVLGLLALVATVVAPSASGGGAATNLGIEKDDSPDPVESGKRLTYTITVTNLTPNAAIGVVVEDKLPTRVDFRSATSSQGTCTRAGRNVTCELGDIPGGGTATIEIRVSPTKTGAITNTATVSADNDPSDATATEATTVIPGPPSCGGSAATIVGTPGDDVIVGTEESDVIAALAGADQVEALGGADKICGARGRDRLKGQADGDLVKGGRGRDKTRGGAGDDTVKGGRRADNLRGGSGDDILAGGPDSDRCRGGSGSDILTSCER